MAGYRDHSHGPKRGYDWKKWGIISALILVVGLALVFLFTKFRPAIVGWFDYALAPIRLMQEPHKPVGALTAWQIRAIEAWASQQQNALLADTYHWYIVRGPDPITRNYQVSLDVQVYWHQTGSQQIQKQVCNLTLQEYRGQNENLYWMVVDAGPNTVCNSKIP